VEAAGIEQVTAYEPVREDEGLWREMQDGDDLDDIKWSRDEYDAATRARASKDVMR
jgi:hypothetical protein